MTEINSKLTNIIKDFGQEAVSKALGELVAFEGGDQAQVFAWKLLIKAASRYRLLSPNVSRSLQVQVEKLSVEPVVN